jgi:hypothetical protein
MHGHWSRNEPMEHCLSQAYRILESSMLMSLWKPVMSNKECQIQRSCECNSLKNYSAPIHMPAISPCQEKEQFVHSQYMQSMLPSMPRNSLASLINNNRIVSNIVEHLNHSFAKLVHRAPELWPLPLVVLIDEGFRGHHQFGMTVWVIARRCVDDVFLEILDLASEVHICTTWHNAHTIVTVNVYAGANSR